jgi:hypothetical protein
VKIACHVVNVDMGKQLLLANDGRMGPATICLKITASTALVDEEDDGDGVADAYTFMLQR